MNKPAVRYALLALVITVVWTMMEHIVGFNTTNHEAGQWARLVGSVVYWGFIFIAIHARRKYQDGLLSFGQGFSTGATVALVYSIGCSLWYAVYGELINTQFKPTLMAFERAKLEKAGASAEKIAVEMKQVDLSSGGSIASYTLLVLIMFVTGCIAALVASLIFQRKKPRKVN
jgi:hypothetical protein